MDNDKFYEQLAEILDVDEVKPGDALKDFETWDSLAILSFLAIADAKYGRVIKAEQIRSAANAEDLARLIEARQ